MSEEARAFAGKLAVVTGAGGFIGSHLAEALVRGGARVRALVRYTSSPSRGALERISPDVLASIEVVRGDVTDPSGARALLHGADVVFHLAALIGIPYSYEAPRQYISVNVGGTLAVLEAARDLGTSRVVLTSTSEVYGSAIETPMSESHPVRAQSPYAASKIAADELGRSFAVAFGAPVVILRPFNAFGPRQSARAIVPSILAQLASGSPRVRVGALGPIRDLTFVDDTVRAFLAAGARDVPFGEAIHVGTGRGVAIGDLVRTAMEVTGRTAAIAEDPARLRPEASEVMALVADSSRAKDLLGWEPHVTLEDGLRRTYADVAAHLAEYAPDRYAT